MKKRLTKAGPPSCHLIAGDCVKVLPELAKSEHAKPKLATADPPYNYGEPYDVYDDNKPLQEYLSWTSQWLTALNAILHPDASIWLFYPDELVSFVDVMCQTELRWHKRSHIVWYYTFGVCNSGGRNFSRSHGHILYYTRKKTKFTFNDKHIRVPSARAMVYGDKRAHPKGKMPDNTWMLLRSQMDEVFVPDEDTWIQSRVCGTYKERQKDSPNQIPVPIMERIILSTSAPGDLVIDPFCGSGTTPVAARMHNRCCIGIDLSKRYIENSARRLHKSRLADNLVVSDYSIRLKSKKR